jgi:transposase-like protein
VGYHGAALPAVRGCAFAQRRQDHAHVRARGRNVFLRLRWPSTDGKPVCPGCGCSICYACPRSGGNPRWRCKACRNDFSVTSGTLFAWHKLPVRTYLLAVAAFCNEVKGKSMLAFARELDVQYKTAFVLTHKLREAMASSGKALHMTGERCGC